MKRVVPILLSVAVLIGLLVVFISKQQAGALNFKYKFAPGQVDRYKMTIDMKTELPEQQTILGPQAPSMTINVSCLETLTVMSVNPDGSAKVKSKISDIQVVAPGAEQMPNVPDMEYTMTMTPDGQAIGVKRTDSGAWNSQPGSQQINSQFGSFRMPKSVVRAGDKWNTNTQTPFGAPMAAVCKLDNQERVGDTWASKIVEEFCYKGTIADLLKQAGASTNSPLANVSGTIDAKGIGTMYFDNEKGKLIKADVDMDMKINMSTAGMQPQRQMPGFYRMPSQMDVTVDATMHTYKID